MIFLYCSIYILCVLSEKGKPSKNAFLKPIQCLPAASIQMVIQVRQVIMQYYLAKILKEQWFYKIFSKLTVLSKQILLDAKWKEKQIILMSAFTIRQLSGIIKGEEWLFLSYFSCFQGSSSTALKSADLPLVAKVTCKELPSISNLKVKTLW